MATVLIRRSQTVNCAEQSIPLGDGADEGHRFQMKGRSGDEEDTEGGGAELFSNLAI